MSSVLALAAALAMSACSDIDQPEREMPLEPEVAATVTSEDLAQHKLIADSVRVLAAGRGITHVPQRPTVRRELSRLGQMLLFDKILSGNRNISCMTCHPPRFGTTDRLSLSIGEGASGMGPGRVHPQSVFIPRNSPPLFNVWVLDNLFGDGRVSRDDNGVIHTPAGAQITPEMAAVFEFGAISALPMFPVTNREEMRGKPGSNDLANIADDDFQGIWSALMARLGGIPDYRILFEQAYPGTPFASMTFAHASNAMAGFIVDAFTLNLTQWDVFLAGFDLALNTEQLNGALKFMGSNCSSCHSGPIFSDDGFQNTGLAQFGPGQGDGPSGRDDFGRNRVTGVPGDLYRFRTPTLRNIELTAPYGHAGQFVDLAEFNDHYSQADLELLAYSDADIPDARLKGSLVDNKPAIIDNLAGRVEGLVFDSVFTREVTAFLKTLTDPRARVLGYTIPLRVPSGLPVDR
jgi:cytochrome c peroxidase